MRTHEAGVRLRGAVASLTAVWFTRHASVHDEAVGLRPFGGGDYGAVTIVGAGPLDDVAGGQQLLWRVSRMVRQACWDARSTAA